VSRTKPQPQILAAVFFSWIKIGAAENKQNIRPILLSIPLD
jgi:hypothetical protein